MHGDSCQVQTGHGGSASMLIHFALLNVKYTTECQILAVERYVILSSHGGSCDKLENVNPIVYNAPDAPSGAPPWWC
jgi:hypothetical protein